MPPIWKIKRELSRVAEQFHALYEIATHPIRQPWIEKKSDKTMRISEGHSNELDVPPQKIALFLVYQPNGLSASTEITCRHLASQGYAVMLIANHAITEKDKARMSSFVWRFIERSNHGYDFGGYKDGIRLLWQWKIDPQHLIILNDSIWFPLDSNCALIKQMEQSTEQFVGAKRHTLSGIPDHEFQGFFESYFFLIKHSTWTHPAFIHYWKNYTSTSNKYLTVRRGERGFSPAMFEAQIPSEGIFSRDRFMDVMSRQDPEMLKKTLFYGAYTEIDFENRSVQLIREFQATDQWVQAALLLINDVVNRRNFISSFCYPCIRLLKISLMKKNKGQLQLLMRRQFIRAVESGDLSKPDAATYQEIQTSITE